MNLFKGVFVYRMMRKTTIAALLLACALVGRAFAQDWGSGVAAPDPWRLSLTAGYERLSQAFRTAEGEERLRRDELRARVDFRPGEMLAVYGFLGTGEFKGRMDSLRSLACGGGVRLLFLGEILVEERDRRPVDLKLGAALDLRATRFLPEANGRGPYDGLTQFQAGLELGLTVMGFGGYVGLAFTRNEGALPYPAGRTAAPASDLNFSSTLGLQAKITRHLGLAMEWSFFGLRSFGVGLRIYP